MAPGSRWGVQREDPARDIRADIQRRVGEAAERLVQRNHVRARGYGLRAEAGGLLHLLDLDAVEEQPADEARRLGLASLACSDRDHVGLWIRRHPVVVTDDRVRAARDPRCIRYTPPEDLELVGHHLRAVCDGELRRRPRGRVLRQPRAGSPAAGRDALAHLDRGAVNTGELDVGRRVERAPVVPALCHRRDRTSPRPGRAGDPRRSTSR